MKPRSHDIVECPVWFKRKGVCTALGVGDCDKGAGNFKDCPTYRGYMRGFAEGWFRYEQALHRQRGVDV